MNKPEADQIAAAVSLIRPSWLQSSLATMLGNLPARHRDRPARDVHLALLWLAYDPQQDTPRLLREDGPWWNLASLTDPRTRPTTEPGIVTRCVHGLIGARCDTCNPKTRQGVPCPPNLRAAMREAIHEAQDVTAR